MEGTLLSPLNHPPPSPNIHQGTSKHVKQVKFTPPGAALATFGLQVSTQEKNHKAFTASHLFSVRAHIASAHLLSGGQPLPPTGPHSAAVRL